MPCSLLGSSHPKTPKPNQNPTLCQSKDWQSPILEFVLLCVPWSSQGSRPVYIRKHADPAIPVWLASLIQPWCWNTHVVCCSTAIPASSLEERKVVVDVHENRRTFIISRKEGELYSRQCKTIIVTHQNSLQTSSIKAHSLILVWVLNKKMFSPVLCRKKTKLKCWQKCCLRASSNCSLRPLPYSQDCILKRGRGRGKSHTTHSQNMTLICLKERPNFWVSPVRNRQGHSHLLGFLC